MSGDTEWLRRWWPNVRRAVEYAWSPDNPDRWDPNRTGVLSGRQHQTFDMELFGPNSWLSTIYVAALLAASEMAATLGEADFAATCEAIGRRGAKYIDDRLFNGRWFVQEIDLSDKGLLAPFDTGVRAGTLNDGLLETYWSDEHAELKYQVGEGCMANQILGQWHAEIAGIGGFLDDRKVAAALKAVHANNFRPTLEDHFNPGRNYAYEDEGGLLNTTYPPGVHQPVVAAPYAEEVWTGIEYMSASHMIMRGLIDEGLDIVRAARNRYDGARRNPWSEIECGAYYARSMSAWQLVNAWAGLSADLVSGRIAFAPKAEGDFTLFWSAGGGFGQLTRRGRQLTLSVLGGSLDIGEVAVAGIGVHRLGRRRPVAAGERLALQLT